MATIANKATNQIKLGAGVIRKITVLNAGTSWTLQLLDGPDSAGNTATLMGASAFTVPAVGTQLLDPFAPLYFRNGLQAVTGGTTAGEIDIQYD